MIRKYGEYQEKEERKKESQGKLFMKYQFSIESMEEYASLRTKRLMVVEFSLTCKCKFPILRFLKNKFLSTQLLGL